MLFRRVIQHVKDQNWTAVGIDFVIVVVGVFIGIQVSNWNSGVQDRSLDQGYMLRLHDEVELSQARMIEIRHELQTQLKFLEQVVVAVSAETPPNQLTQDQCDAVFGSHIYRPTSVSIPTLDELLASGRASVLSDEELRASILLFAQLRSATEGQRAAFGVQGQVIDLSIEFPETITLNSEITFDRFGFAPFGGHTCNIDRMIESAAFRNTLTNNLYRMTAFLTLNFEPELDQLEQVDRLLKERLRISA
ncbi:MAG: hypothetical protein VX599_00360 [Pseudomonadota bacterium]|nr:hypothetical protein [Pseudomonadota bacterium]